MTEESKTPVQVFASPEAIGEFLAPMLLSEIAKARAAEEKYLLGCPTGRTPKPIYSAIAKLIAPTDDLSHLVLVMMDEYLVTRGKSLEYAAGNHPWSCHYFTRVEIADRWNAKLPAAQQVKGDSIWFPDPRAPLDYDKKIKEAGGIDFFLLASGATDGHVAFNPPGSARNSRTRVIELSESTRRDNLQTFPAFGSLDNVPKHGISVGIDTIARAKRKAMVVWGEGKSETLRRIVTAEQYDLDWPATVVHEGVGGEILADESAAQGLGV